MDTQIGLPTIAVLWLRLAILLKFFSEKIEHEASMQQAVFAM